MADLLPPLPVDDEALALYMAALRPGPEAERSSLGELLDLYSQMAGSDPEAVEEVLHESWDGEPDMVVLRDPMYHPNDLIVALIDEIQRLRGAQP